MLQKLKFFFIAAMVMIMVSACDQDITTDVEDEIFIVQYGGYLCRSRCFLEAWEIVSYGQARHVGDVTLNVYYPFGDYATLIIDRSAWRSNNLVFVGILSDFWGEQICATHSKADLRILGVPDWKLSDNIPRCLR